MKTYETVVAAVKDLKSHFAGLSAWEALDLALRMPQKDEELVNLSSRKPYQTDTQTLGDIIRKYFNNTQDSHQGELLTTQDVAMHLYIKEGVHFPFSAISKELKNLGCLQLHKKVEGSKHAMTVRHYRLMVLTDPDNPTT